MIKLANQAHEYYQFVSNALSKLHSVVVLAIRFYIAKVFFLAGLTKLQDWETTLFLFEEEYQVPLLNFEVAAYLATFGEIVLPVLLIAGLFTRFSAVALSVVNAVAVVSLIEIAPAALYLHVIWGVLLAQVAIYGGGVISLDQLLKKTWLNKAKA
ncbi:DoxX family protein [Litoribacillus peritrichatus]|uniref:DoxX family protein n=1 Tax=Litoribacillus peritrichatus TaxID=718191 RepID=A0ABP7MV35_9GAMM